MLFKQQNVLGIKRNYHKVQKENDIIEEFGSPTLSGKSKPSESEFVK